MKGRRQLSPERRVAEDVQPDRIKLKLDAEEFIRWLFRDQGSLFPKISERTAMAVARLLATKVAARHDDPDACHALAGNICRLVLLFKPKPIATLAQAKQLLDTLPRCYNLAGMTWSDGLSGFLDDIDQRQLDEVFLPSEVSSVYVAENGGLTYLPPTIETHIAMKLAVAHEVLQEAGVRAPFAVIVRLARECGFLKDTYCTIQHVYSRVKHITKQSETNKNDSKATAGNPFAKRDDPRIVAKFWIDYFYKMRGIR